MTIDEATTKWCPFAMIGTTFNRIQKIPSDASCPCIANKCMAWRWDKGPQDQGHCGLAGDE